ncbi:hypothetical protein [Flavobacterium sp.]|uniref:hypothetical protein n=1 Tax=Flavobacterium sp. TaxID=239 RepID=UPI003266403D
MSNFFLLNDALKEKTFDAFKIGMINLAIINKDKDDVFLRHDSIWNVPMIEELYTHYGGFNEKVIFTFLEQLSQSYNYFSSEIEMNLHYVHQDNGFLGIDFTDSQIELEMQITNHDSYLTFNHKHLWNVNFRNFWIKKEKLFPNLIMCGEIQNQINQIGNSGYFNQIIEKLKEFNLAVSKWKTGNFSYREMNAGYALKISPESDTTMSKYGNERICQLPNGGTDFFELHIKTGDLRFHFLPDNNTKKVYIGYIGPHLTI